MFKFSNLNFGGLTELEVLSFMTSLFNFNTRTIKLLSLEKFPMVSEV